MPHINNRIRVVQEKRPEAQSSIEQGAEVAQCKSHDTTPAQTPVLRRAMAFELAPEGSSVVPTPPPPSPAPVPRRDPVLIELGQIELGAKVQFISLSDDPEANFVTGKVFELPITGYDENNGIATIVLNAEMMKEKGIDPGERIVLRQVDRNGNASDGVFAHLDPAGWANQQIQQPGGPRVAGAQIDYQVGIHNVTGVAGADPTQVAQSQRVIGTAVRDSVAPILIEKNVKVSTVQWSQKERDIATHLLTGPGVQNVLSRAPFGGNLTVETMKQALTTPGNLNLGEKTLEMFSFLIDNKATFEKFDRAAYGGLPDGIIGAVDLQEVSANAKSTFFALEMALEPGTTGTVRNNRTNVAVDFSIADNQRMCHFKLNGLENGDGLVLEYADRQGNPGKSFSFEYSADAKDGKKTLNLVNAQVESMVNDPLSALLEVAGKKLRKVVDGRSIGATNATPAWLLAGTSTWVGDGFFKPYLDNAAKLGLPLGNKAPGGPGFEQQFEKGKLLWDNATGAASVQLN